MSSDAPEPAASDGRGPGAPSPTTPGAMASGGDVPDVRAYRACGGSTPHPASDSPTCDIEGCDEPAVSVWFDDETFTDFNICEGCAT